MGGEERLGDLDKRRMVADQLLSRPASSLRGPVEGREDAARGGAVSAFARPALHDRYTHVGWNYASLICCSNMNETKLLQIRHIADK